MRSHEHGLVPLGRYWGGRAWRHNQVKSSAARDVTNDANLIPINRLKFRLLAIADTHGPKVTDKLIEQRSLGD